MDFTAILTLLCLFPWSFEPSPTLADLTWLSPPQLAEQNYLIAWKWRGRLTEMPLQWGETHEARLAALTEADRRFKVWDWLDDAHRIHVHGDSWRCQRLAKLRNLLGREAYYQAWFPSPVPPWDFAGK